MSEWGPDNEALPDYGDDALERRLAASERVRRQLAEALRQIEFLPYSVTGDVEADLRRTKEIAHVALAASDALEEKQA